MQERLYQIGIIGKHLRKKLMTDAVPRRIHLIIRGVMARRVGKSGEEIFDFLLRDREEGTDQLVMLWRHARQTAGAAPAQQVKKDRLGLIVCMMRQCDQSISRFLFDLPQRLIAERARHRLDRAAAGASSLLDIDIPTKEGDPKPLTDALHIPRLFFGLLAQMMLYEAAADREPFSFGDVMQKEKEPERIRPAGHRREDPLPSLP